MQHMVLHCWWGSRNYILGVTWNHDRDIDKAANVNLISGSAFKVEVQNLSALDLHISNTRNGTRFHKIPAFFNDVIW